MEVLTALSWLIFILVRFVYFTYLVHITLKGSGLERGQQYDHNSHFSLLRAVLLSAGGLWLWSRMAEFFYACLICFIALCILDSSTITNSGDTPDQLFSTVFMAVRCIAGVVWLWSLENRLLFIPLYFYFTYKIVLFLRGDDTNVRRDTRGGNHPALAPDDDTEIRRDTGGGNNNTPGGGGDDTNEKRDTKGGNNHPPIAPDDETYIRRRDTKSGNNTPGGDDDDDTHEKRDIRSGNHPAITPDDDTDTIRRDDKSGNHLGDDDRNEKRDTRGGNNHPAIAPDDETNVRRDTGRTGNHPGDDDDTNARRSDTRGGNYSAIVTPGDDDTIVWRGTRRGVDHPETTSSDEEEDIPSDSSSGAGSVVRSFLQVVAGGNINLGHYQSIKDVKVQYFQKCRFKS